MAGVYYRVVEADANQDQAFGVIKEDKVTVKNTVTKEMMNTMESNNSLPTLTITAYASQYENGDSRFEAAEAWANVNAPPP